MSASASPAIGKRGGNGLKNMRQRLIEIGGECLISSQPAAGTVVTVRIRLDKKTADEL
jgi:signal transduction histidine kinase